jgi:VIT1/CCC1 family predicted Fe2+/Mn2+ transporter
MQSGAQEALDRQPIEHRTEQTKLAVSLLNRSELALALAIGQLPPEQQAEILKIVDKALSSLASERDEAQRLLKEKDAELRTVTKERDAIKEELPKLAAQVEEAKAKAAAKTEEVKVAQVKLSTWATIKDKADRHASSLAGQVESLWNGLLWLAAIYVFLAFVLPAIVKVIPSGTTKNALRIVAGVFTSPILFLDAMRKLAAQKGVTSTK